MDIGVSAALVDDLQLGQRDTTDYLAVSFSALDLLGHDFGPDSREVEDLLIRLDETLGTLLQRLDARVGRDNYVVALTADWVIELRVENEATNHGTFHDYDPRVPILMWGQRVRPGRYGARVSPADIAPTLAYLAGVTLPDADGRMLPVAIR